MTYSRHLEDPNFVVSDLEYHYSSYYKKILIRSIAGQIVLA